MVHVLTGAASEASVRPVTNWFVHAVGVPTPEADPVDAIQLVPSDLMYLPDVAEALGKVGVDQTGAVDEPDSRILFAVAVEANRARAVPLE